MVFIVIPALVTLINGSEAVAEVDGQPHHIDVFLTPEVRIGGLRVIKERLCHNGC